MTQVVPGIARNTRQRQRVLALLDGADGFRSAQQLHTDLQSGGAKVGLTTVYRTLQLLAEAGEVDQMRLGGDQLYRRCGQTGHHHHLTCRACGRAVDIEGPAVEKWADTLAAHHGFVDVDHTVEIVGTCADCAPAVPV